MHSSQYFRKRTSRKFLHVLWPLLQRCKFLGNPSFSLLFQTRQTRGLCHNLEQSAFLRTVEWNFRSKQLSRKCHAKPRLVVFLLTWLHLTRRYKIRLLSPDFFISGLKINLWSIGFLIPIRLKIMRCGRHTSVSFDGKYLNFGNAKMQRSFGWTSNSLVGSILQLKGILLTENYTEI